MYGCAMGLGWIVSLVLIGIIIYLINQKNTQAKSEKSAQDILDERYAKGEISEQAYEEKSKNLEKR